MVAGDGGGGWDGPYLRCLPCRHGCTVGGETRDNSEPLVQGQASCGDDRDGEATTKAVAAGGKEDLAEAAKERGGPSPWW